MSVKWIAYTMGFNSLLPYPPRFAGRRVKDRATISNVSDGGRGDLS